MLRTMPRAISLVVRGNFGVGDVSVGINVDTASVPPGVGVGLDPVFVEAGKREHPLRISTRQYMMNMIIRVRGRWRIPCPSKNLSKLSHLKTPCVYACGGCQFASLQLASIQIFKPIHCPKPEVFSFTIQVSGKKRQGTRRPGCIDQFEEPGTLLFFKSSHLQLSSRNLLDKKHLLYYNSCKKMRNL